MICPSCKSQCKDEWKVCPKCAIPLHSKNPQRWTKKIKNALIIGAAFVITIALFTHAITTDLEKDSTKSDVVKKDIPASTQKVEQQNTKKSPTDYKGKRDEMLDALNGIESKNMYRTLYDGLTMRDNTLTIKVTDQWSYMSKDARVGFAKHIMTMWLGMAGAREINVNTDDFHLKIVHNQSARTLATWDSLWGVSIND